MKSEYDTLLLDSLQWFSVFTIVYDSSPRPFWHWGQVSWKTIFPWTRDEGDGSKGITFTVHFISIIITPEINIIYFNYYNISHHISELGTPGLQNCYAKESPILTSLGKPLKMQICRTQLSSLNQNLQFHKIPR